MKYQHEKDRCLYENAMVANENARLSIFKQGKMVHCLANLSSVLRQSLIMTNGETLSNMPQSTTRDGTTTLKPSNIAKVTCSTAVEDQAQANNNDMPIVAQHTKEEMTLQSSTLT